jgi:hypothetical protein
MSESGLPKINHPYRPPNNNQTVLTVQNDKQFFGAMKGLGPVNVGTEAWNEAMTKKERMEAYVQGLNTTQSNLRSTGRVPSRMYSETGSRR